MALVRRVAQHYEDKAAKSEGLLRESFGLSADNYRIIADRLEAAAKRDEERAVEHATRHAEAVARDNCRDCVHNPNGKSYEGGNAAAMREALEKARGVIKAMGGYWARETLPIIDAALSKPARNCDRFQVAAEALQEWQSLVKAKPNTWDFRYNYWLFAPAAERKGDGDGSK